MRVSNNEVDSKITTEYDVIKIGERLKKLRHEKGGKQLTQDKMAEELGYNCVDAYARYERGKVKDISIEFILKVADYHKVSTDYILCRETRYKNNDEGEHQNNVNKIVAQIKGEINKVFEKHTY